jgi:group I intron endonuclease
MATNRVNGKRYIGKTINSLGYRKAQHNSAKAGWAFSKAIHKYGKECFEWCVLFDGNDANELTKNEITLIAMFQTIAPRGYNLTIGGEGAKRATRSMETRQKIREARLGARGNNLGHSGWKHTEETRKSISNSLKNHQRTAEHSKNISIGLKLMYKRKKLTPLTV